MEDKKVSIIVPLYNTETYIKRCLDSISHQTYRNIEIIVVDDGGKDNSSKIVKECMNSDRRIKLITHNINKGLYHARITGVEAAEGDYIGFVDSDDYISRDFVRTLVYKAEESNADIVVGKIVHEDEKGYRYIHNLYHFYDFGILEGEVILRSYWEQEGRCFIWHTIWNKLYSKKLWDKALPVLKRQKKHLIMTEDFVFSSVLMNFAERLTSVEYGAYFYFQHSGASTSTKGGITKFEKNIHDLKTAFDFVYHVIKQDNYRIDAEKQFGKWSDLYLYFWQENIEKSSLNENEKLKASHLLGESLKDFGNEIRNPSYFYAVSAEYDSRYDNLIAAVCAEDVTCVSFDIFDTAIVRPFYQPTDLFMFMNSSFKNMVSEERRHFSDLRIRAEQLVRNKKLYGKTPLQEDVSIKEIYETIEELSSVDKDILNQFMNKEADLEIQFSHARKSIFNLYKAAVHCGKKIYFTTDMYLLPETIQGILEKNGYSEYDALLVSAQENASKRTGKLFDVLLEHSGAAPEEVIHIDDNWESGITQAQGKGIKAYFYPSVLNCIQYNIPDIKTTHSCCPYTEPSGNMFNFEKSIQFLGTRSALAVAANRLYDNPFISFNEWTEMNCSPEFLGGYALGMHLLGFVKWFTEKSIEKEYDTLLFIARDGYLPMKAYEIIKFCYSYAPEARYLYTSRKAAFAAGVHAPNDLYSLYDNIDHKSCTIEAFLKLLSPILSEIDIKQLCKEGFEPYSAFKDYSHYCRFIKWLIHNGFDQDKCNTYQQNLSDYFTPQLFGKSACVDIGYSGRTQEMLHRVTGIHADAFYVHTNDEHCSECARENNFSVYTYYDATPSITGGAREVLFSKYAPSCTGYAVSGSETKPIFEKFQENYPACYVINEIQKSALRFIEDFCKYFGNYMELMEMRSSDVSYPYEYFLHTLTDADSKMFDCIDFEDDMWAGKTMPLPEYWKECIRYHKIIPFYMQGKEHFVEQPYTEEEMEYKVYIENGLDKKSSIKKALYWYLVDKEFFQQRLKDHKKK